MSLSRTRIHSVTVEPLNIPLQDPFMIATGGITAVQNVLITIILQDGTIGYGECAPLPPSTGESQDTVLASATACIPLLQGQDVAHWRQLARLLRSLYFAQATMCAGMEMAILDALTRSHGIPLWVFFGGTSNTIETDLSIPILPIDRAFVLAKDAAAKGIGHLKIKVGSDLREDVDRVEAIRSGAPQAVLTLDANQGYTPHEALICLEALDDRGIRPLLLEQPVHKDDFAGLRYISQHTTVPIAADESASSPAAVARLLGEGCVSVINIKLAKSGFVGALEIAALCQAYHAQLMIGEMIESRLGTAAAAHFTAGLGGFNFIDLDTPMLMTEDPFTGGYEQRSAVYDLSKVERGLGIERAGNTR